MASLAPVRSSSGYVSSHSQFFAQSNLRTCSVDTTVCTPSLLRRSCVRSRDTCTGDLAMCRSARFCHISSVSTSLMNFCCIQQHAPNQRLPQPDFGAQSNGSRSPQSTRISSLDLDGLGNPHLCLCARISLGLQLAPEILDNSCGSSCFTSKCELVCSAGSFCIDAARTWSCSSNQYLQFCFCSHAAFQFRALVTPFQQTWKVGSSARKSESSPSHPRSRGQTGPICSHAFPR